MILNAGMTVMPEMVKVFTILAILFVLGLPIRIWLYRRKQKQRMDKPLFLLHLPKVQEILTQKQIDKASVFYSNHKEHIDRIVSLTQNAYEPSQVEDKNNPSIWKAEYWRWFLANS